MDSNESRCHVCGAPNIVSGHSDKTTGPVWGILHCSCEPSHNVKGPFLTQRQSAEQ